VSAEDCSGRYCVRQKSLFEFVHQLGIQEKSHQCPIPYTALQKKNRVRGVTGMSKHEIIDCIMEINRTARQEFLDQFSKEDLDLYLEHLMEVDLEEIALCA